MSTHDSQKKNDHVHLYHVQFNSMQTATYSLHLMKTMEKGGEGTVRGGNSEGRELSSEELRGGNCQVRN